MPLQETSGAASYDAFGGGLAAGPNYIEEVFSTWLYTGNGTTQAITNGINLSGKGGLVWIKSRDDANDGHGWYDTVRGAGTSGTDSRALSSNSQAGQNLSAGNNYDYVSAFSSTGFSVTYPPTGRLNGTEIANQSGSPYVSWTFREQPKFFDIVTYTGTGANRTIAHNLGSVPGMIIVKRTDTTGAWQVYHRSLANTQYMVLNTTAAVATGATRWNSTTPTSTVFSVGTDSTVNANGGTYVAYLFAHNAGGFGLTGTDNVISCGIYSGNDATVSVNLGYEAQWVLIKATGSAGNWYVFDNMRGMAVIGNTVSLKPNLTAAETDTGQKCRATATGFIAEGDITLSGSDYIYIAIRRGPMKVPTTGASVFSPITVNVASGTSQTTGFVVDSQWKALRASTSTLNTNIDDRLRGVSTNTTTASGNYLITSDTAAEATTNATTFGWNNTGFLVPSFYSNLSSVYWSFGRAPGFFDQVCYTGTGVSGQTFAHNLGVAPEIMIVKRRSSAINWQVYTAPTGATQRLVLNVSSAASAGTAWNNTAPTASVFTLGSDTTVNTSGQTYINYLFASCPGVSKVGSYTGTGATQIINCGFSAGTRFVLIKRTDNTGNWFVWDSARGIVAGNDPYLRLDSTAAEVTTTDWVDTAATGFELSNAVGNSANISAATYIFLAIA